MDWGSREEIAYATSLSFNFFRENEEGGVKKPTNFLPQPSVATRILISATYLKLSFQH